MILKGVRRAVEVSDDCWAVYIGRLLITRFKPFRASATYG